MLIGALAALYVRYFVPCVTEACETGYVDRIEKSGQLLKSYEGVLLPHKNPMDTSGPHEGDFRFSTTTDTDVAVRLKKMHFANLPGARALQGVPYRCPLARRDRGLHHGGRFGQSARHPSSGPSAGVHQESDECRE